MRAFVFVLALAAVATAPAGMLTPAAAQGTPATPPSDTTAARRGFTPEPPPTRVMVPRPTITPYTPAPRITVTPQGTFQFTMPDPMDVPPLSQRAFQPLDGDQQARLRVAQRLRQEGQIAAAHDSVSRLLALLPHHPVLLAELARVLTARSDWAGIERLARAERGSQHDSLLLGRDLAEALEHLKRPRDAVAVVFEGWQVRPAEADWAVMMLARLANADSRGVREQVRRMATANPDRVDYASAAAALDWKMGDGALAMKALAAADRPGLTPPLRWRFADALLATGAPRDSGGAVEALVSMAADVRFDASRRMLAARRVMEVHRARGTLRDGTPAVYKALADVPHAGWNGDLLVDVARGLRLAGQTAAARALLDAPASGASAKPGVTLERALDDLHEGPPTVALERLRDIAASSQEAAFRYAEALLFAGMPDSALAQYKRVSADPNGEFTGGAFERMYLIEDAKPKTALPAVGRLMWLDWRGDAKESLALSDSLYGSLPRGPLWARVAVFRGQHLDAAGLPQDALVPLLELANNLPEDRLAPLARELAGDIYQFRLKQDVEARAQYEECLTRYPRAWNSAEVRRRLEALRKKSGSGPG